MKDLRVHANVKFNYIGTCETEPENERMSEHDLSLISPDFLSCYEESRGAKRKRTGDRRAACGQVSGFRGLPRGSSL